MAGNGLKHNIQFLLLAKPASFKYSSQRQGVQQRPNIQIGFDWIYLESTGISSGFGKRNSSFVKLEKLQENSRRVTCFLRARTH